MKKASARFRLATVCLAAMLASCSKDPPPKPDDGPKKSTPVPSDMVFNDFVPPTGAGGGIVGVKGADGGLEAGADLGTASTADGGGAGGGAAAAPGADDASKLKVTDPGAEPRVVRRYAFVANKTEKRVMTIKQSVTIEGGQSQEVPAIAVSVDLTPKVVKPTGARFEVKVTNVDFPEAPPAQKAQIAAQLGVFKGFSGQFDISKEGEIGELDFKADEKLQQAGQLAELVLQTLQQGIMEMLVVPFPEAALGAGAKWERSEDRAERGMRMSQKHSYTLKDATAEGGAVDVETDVVLPKTAVPQRGAPPGAVTQEVKSKGVYHYAIKVAGVATKVDAETKATQIKEVNDGKQKQRQAANIKIKMGLESK